MGGPSASVFTGKKTLDDVLEIVESCLSELAEIVSSGRRGINWQVRMRNGVIDVLVKPTEEILEEFEDELLELELVPEDAPFHVGMCAFSNQPVDWEDLAILSATIADRTGGVATPPIK